MALKEAVEAAGVSKREFETLLALMQQHLTLEELQADKVEVDGGDDGEVDGGDTVDDTVDDQVNEKVNEKVNEGQARSHTGGMHFMLPAVPFRNSPAYHDYQQWRTTLLQSVIKAD